MLARNGVAKAANNTYNKFIDAINDAKIPKKASKFADQASDMIKDNPVRSVLIGLGVGFLLMKLIRR